MPFEYLSFTYMQAFSYSFPVKTVCACYVHSHWLLVWVLIMLFDDDLIHLFLQDEILECRLQNINVIELTFTQMLKILTAAHLIWCLLCSGVGILALNDQPHTFLWKINSWGPNNVGLWLTEQILASPSSFTERPNFASI